MEPIPLPSQLRWVPTSNPNEQKLIIEPLFPGYGTTVGNALRRVLLSSLEGAAVTSIRVDGVEHEFSTVEHVKEDMVEILLNIKRLRFRSFSDDPVTLRIDTKGVKVVTAGDIERQSGAEVVDPTAVIATLTDKNAHLAMDLVVERGRGYTPTEARDSKQKLPLGAIAVDALFTPVRNVGMELEHVRVGQMTNFDRITLSITTDGSLTAEEAVRQSLGILLGQFSHIQGLIEQQTYSGEEPFEDMKNGERDPEKIENKEDNDENEPVKKKSSDA